MAERLVAVLVIPWTVLSLTGFYTFALPQLAWKQWTR